MNASKRMARGAGAAKLAAALLLLVPCLSAPVRADEHGHAREQRGEWHSGQRGERFGERHGEWHGDIGRFHERDLERWRGGRWYDGRHDGRLGWWWIVGGVWYFYPGRVDPYPDPYQPPLNIAPLPPAAPMYWYYCDDPAGYYPYVPECRFNWRPQPAQPAAPYPEAPR